MSGNKYKEDKIVDEYLNFQKTYQEKYGPNTVVFMEVGHFFEMYAIDEPETLIKITEILNIQLSFAKQFCFIKYDRTSMFTSKI